MSRGTVVAKRYAKALFQLALEQGVVSETEQQLKLVVSVVESDAQVRAFLSAPNISLEAKLKALKSGFAEDKAASIVLNTIGLLIERGREDMLDALLAAFLKVAGEVLRRADAHVITSKPLSEEEVQKIASQFGALLGKTVRVTAEVDPELLGGIKVKIGDTLYDGSLKSKLERLEKTLHSAAI